MKPMILHVQHPEQHGGPYRITTEQPDTEADLLALLWQGDAPQGTALTLVDQQLGYNKFDLSGLNNENSSDLRADAFAWLDRANLETYEAHEPHTPEAHLDAEVPHLGGVTFRQVRDNYDAWKGLHEVDGYLVWVGWDPGPQVNDIQMYPMGSEHFNNNIRWFVDQGNTLGQAMRLDLEHETDMLQLVVLGFVGAGHL